MNSTLRFRNAKKIRVTFLLVISFLLGLDLTLVFPANAENIYPHPQNKGHFPRNSLAYRTKRQSTMVRERGMYNSAIVLIKAGKYKQAIPFLEKALQNEPHNTLIKADLVLCLIWTSSYQKATEYYAKYEKELNRVEYIPRNIAKAFYEMGMYSKAELLYDQALLNDQSDGEALKGLVYSLCQKENYTHAKQIIEQYSIQSIIAHDIINSLNAYVLQKEGKYMQAYILFMKLNLTEEKEYTVKELQDKRKEIFSHLTKEEIGLLEEEYRKNSIFSGIIAMDRGQYGFLSSTDTESLDECSYGLLLELAWDHFKAQRDEKAIEVYRFIMNTWPSSCLARIGSVYPLSRKGMLEESQKLLTWAYEHDCFLIDALFSEAFMYEKKRDFLKAIEVYDRILEKKPHHTAALKLKIRNIADLGMISSAYQLAQQEGIKDERFISDLESDMIIDRLKWEEENEAISLLEQQLKDYSENYRVLCDYIVALRKKERMEEVIEQFENVKSMGKPIPYWVTEAVADAYLYLEKPREALKFYKITLERKPYDVFDPLMGLFYSYQELRDWENANSTLKHIKEIMSKEKLDKWQRLEATMAQGWYHIHRDELDDAQDYFESYLTQAGMNTDFRTGLAHVYLWRGRPRKALQELKIAENIAPDDVDVQSGMILTLEELNAKKKARALAEKLNQKFPTKKQLRDTYDTLKVEDMNKFTTKALFVNENPGSQEYWISSLLEEPLFPTLKLFQEITWQKTSDDSVGGKTEFKWNRAGLGGEWIVKQPLIWKQALTFDYQEGDEFGYDTTLTWTPKDRLKITAGYDSFYLDIPIRARAEGIEGEHAFWDIYWHEHEARQYGFSSGYTWYDDRNLNSYYTLYLDQRVLNTPDFNIRLGGQVHYSTNKKTDVSYFSPLNEFTFLLKPTFHWIHFLRYNRKFQSNLYFRFGVYKQHLFDYHTIGGITYEQMIALSKTFEFLWNVSWDQKVYDGDAADVWEGSCILKKSF